MLTLTVEFSLFSSSCNKVASWSHGKVRFREFRDLSHHGRRTITRANSGVSNCDVGPGPSLLRTAVHRPRPTLMFLPGLRSLPFWTQYHSTENVNLIAYQDPTVQYAVHLLERHAIVFKTEYEQVSKTMKSDYQPGTEHQLHDGVWDWHSYMMKGKLQGHFQQYFPETSAVLQQLRDNRLLFEGTPFGYSFFSSLHSHSKIKAHTAPMNLRLRIHLPLLVPPSNINNDDANLTCGIRVGHLHRQWQQDVALVLDDSYEHEVWNNTDHKRVILLVDIWHPDVTQQERDDIVGMFQHAQQQGWWSSHS